MIFIPILTKSFTIKNVLLWAEKKMCMKIKNKKKKYIFFFSFLIFCFHVMDNKNC